MYIHMSVQTGTKTGGGRSPKSHHTLRTPNRALLICGAFGFGMHAFTAEKICLRIVLGHSGNISGVESCKKVGQE